MHNFLEGILQHQLCSLWGIGHDEDESQKLKEMDYDEQWTDADLSESADELDELRCEADEYKQRNLNKHNTPPPMSASSSPSSGTASPTMVTPTKTILVHIFILEMMKKMEMTWIISQLIHCLLHSQNLTYRKLKIAFNI